MTKTKHLIPIILLFIVVGLAIVTTSLSMEGTTTIAADSEDFKVYFSKVQVDGEESDTLLYNSTTINYTRTLTSIGESYTMTYDVTNASKSFDAEISINCTAGDEYLSATNTFDTSILPARTTRTGELVIKKTKSNSTSEEKNYTLKCELTATAVSRDELGTNEVPDALENTIYAIGREITIGSEKFNIISETDTTVTMFAQYNIGTDYRQSTTTNNVTFSDTNGWEHTPGPEEIDIQTWSTNPKTYVNEYVSYLQGETGDTTLSGNLITLAELGNLGCTIPTDYAWGSSGWTCTGSEHSNWLINGQSWWTRSASSGSSYSVWMMDGGGNLSYDTYDIDYGVRPVITISKEIIQNYL